MLHTCTFTCTSGYTCLLHTTSSYYLVVALVCSLTVHTNVLTGVHVCKLESISLILLLPMAAGSSCLATSGHLPHFSVKDNPASFAPHKNTASLGEFDINAPPDWTLILVKVH